jgi:hypothetical protein
MGRVINCLYIPYFAASCNVNWRRDREDKSHPEVAFGWDAVVRLVPFQLCSPFTKVCYATTSAVPTYYAWCLPRLFLHTEVSCMGDCPAGEKSWNGYHACRLPCPAPR